jgi:YYY domain-containing protein
VDSFPEIARWYALTTLVALALAPLTLILFRRLTDRGAGLARTVSMLAFIWPAWFLSGVFPDAIPFGAPTLWTTIAAGGIVSWLLAFRFGVLDREVVFHLLVAEIGYLTVFAAYCWYRGYDPVIQGTEKLSDLMMFSSSMRASDMPPHDAWLAGETINYYYVGYLPWASIARLGDIAPTIGYNLALASIFASVVSLAVSVTANVIGRFYGMLAARIGGLISALFVFMATPWALTTAIEERETIWDARWWAYMWPASRQLDGGTPEAISEFPAFSFQLADLHPHVLALPFTILALGFAWMLITIRDGDSWGPNLGDWVRIAITGGFVGALYATNSWDYPAYALLALIGLVIGTATWPLGSRIVAAVMLGATSIAAWAPFYMHFEAPTATADSGFSRAVDDIPVIGTILSSISGYDGPYTTLWDYIGLLGFPWIVGIALIAWELWNRRELPSDPAVIRLVLVAATLVAIVGILIPRPLLILAGIPVLIVILLWHKDHSVSAANIALALYATGLSLTIVPEFIYLVDVYNNRMNIVFKLYYQAWIMLALGAAIAIVVLAHAARRAPLARIAVALCAVVIIWGGLVGTVIGSHQWNEWRNPANDEWLGLDGFAFLNDNPQTAGETAGIAWLLDNASEDDVMLTAGGCEFSDYMGQTASASGVPTVLGWQGHEWQWHLGQDGYPGVLLARVADINAMWETADPALFDRYGVTLIYMGPIERNGSPSPRDSPDEGCSPGRYPNAANPEFPGEGWTEVFSDESGTRIYRRDGA